MLKLVKAKAKLLCAQVKGKLRGAALNMAIECIQTAENLSINCLIGCCWSTIQWPNNPENPRTQVF